MNWKLFISTLLMLVLLHASAFGLACDVRCGLEATAGDHGHVDHASRNSNAPAPMHCHSMHLMRHAGSSQTPASCESADSACGQGNCASDTNWLMGQKASNVPPVSSALSPLDTAMSVSGALAAVSFSRELPLPPSLHRPVSVLRI
jgi:hypothetical protein